MAGVNDATDLSLAARFRPTLQGTYSVVVPLVAADVFLQPVVLFACQERTVASFGVGLEQSVSRWICAGTVAHHQLSFDQTSG
jgi:hypothetical protein